MPRGINGGNKAFQFIECGTKFPTRFSENPPIYAVAASVISFSFGAHSLSEMLIYIWKILAYIIKLKPKKVDH